MTLRLSDLLMQRTRMKIRRSSRRKPTTASKMIHQRSHLMLLMVTVEAKVLVPALSMTVVEDFPF